MKLAQLFSDFEEELIRQGEEAESLLSFVYRSLKNLSLQTLSCPPARGNRGRNTICRRNLPAVSVP